MKKINKTILFVKAHAMARKMVGDYRARFALALRTLYKQFKEAVKPVAKALKSLYILGEDEYREISIMEAVKDEYVTADEVKETLAGGKNKEIYIDSDYILCFEF